MGKVLIIGAGGVGTVVAHKVAQNPDVFTRSDHHGSLSEGWSELSGYSKL